LLRREGLRIRDFRAAEAVKAAEEAMAELGPIDYGKTRRNAPKKR